MKPYFTDEQATLYLGDALTALQSLPDASINCCVTSPPYFGLRSYLPDGVVLRDDLTDDERAYVLGELGSAGDRMTAVIFSKSQIPEHLHRYFRPAEIGAEKSPAEYVAALVAVMAEVRRVLADDGTLWLSLGDSYSGGGGGGGGKHATIGGFTSNRNSRDHYERVGLGPKNLLGIPWRVAFALQDDGWILRNDVIWAKPNGMPESVTDRLSTKHEHLFLLAKSRRYWFDLDPIREPLMYPDAADGTNKADKLQTGSSARRTGGAYGKPRSVDEGWNTGTGLAPHTGHRGTHEQGRNPGDVWTIPTQPFTGAHFAVFPVEIPRRAIAAGCKPGGVVLDPFSGSGTTGLAAAELGRRYVGIDLNRDYLELSLRTRLSQPSLTAEVGS